MKAKFQVMLSEDFDEELNAIAVITILLRRLTFDQQWRVLNYAIVRILGRPWSLAKPAGDTKP